MKKYIVGSTLHHNEDLYFSAPFKGQYKKFLAKRFLCARKADAMAKRVNELTQASHPGLDIVHWVEEFEEPLFRNWRLWPIAVFRALFL